MHRLFLAWLAAGCTSEPPPPAPPSGDPLPFDQTGAGPVLQLDRLPGRFTLPAGSHAGGVDALGEISIEGLSADGGLDGELACHAAALPFDVAQRAGFRFAPPGMKLTADGVELPYEPFAHRPNRRPHWTLERGRLHVAVPAPPRRVTVSHEGVTRRVRRLELAASGLAPEDFVRFHHTIGDRTREGLLLPAPGVGEWEVDVPTGARFEAWVAIIPPPVRIGSSDGATAVLEVVEAGATKEVARRAISASVPFFQRLTGGTAEFGRWTADLSPWAGRRVTLRLRTDPGGTPDHDAVFLGSPTVHGAPSAPVRRVVVLAIDTLRPDHLGAHGYARDTSPEMDALAARSAVFDSAWAPAPRTRPSFRTATTGLRPLDAVGGTNIGEVFDRHGFATAGIVANVHLNPRFGFHRGFDDWWLDTTAKADDQVTRAISWLEAHRDRDSYLFLHLMDPHLFYIAPEPYGSRFVEDPDPSLPDVFNRWQVLEWARDGRLDERRKRHMTALYDGEVAWTSAQVGRLVEALDALGGANLIVLHSDHGEELFDHGGFEHNHTLYDEVVRAALWIRPPGPEEGRRIAAPAQLADIAPTLYDYAGFADAPTTDGRSLRPLIEGRSSEEADRRPIDLGHLMYDLERWGVIWEGHKYVVETATGEEDLFDLTADPGENDDLVGRVDTSRFWPALAEAHGMQVAPGWRVELKLKSPDLTLVLPAPATGAGVIDPEAARQHRANAEWGEVPDVLPSDVAIVRLSEDGRTLHVERGSVGEGTLWVTFAQPTPAEVEIRRGETVLSTLKSDAAWWRGKGDSVTVRPGVVVVPPPSEAERMGLVEAGGSDELELLESLGYVGEGHPK